MVLHGVARCWNYSMSPKMLALECIPVCTLVQPVHGALKRRFASCTGEEDSSLQQVTISPAALPWSSGSVSSTAKLHCGMTWIFFPPLSWEPWPRTAKGRRSNVQANTAAPRMPQPEDVQHLYAPQFLTLTLPWCLMLCFLLCPAAPQS